MGVDGTARWATLIGLCAALGGPALLAGPAGSLLGDPARVRTHFIGQLTMWALFGLLVVIMVWERLPLSSIGLNSWNSNSVVWGLGAAVIVFAACGIVNPFLMRAGMVDLSKGLAVVFAWPLWLRVFGVLTAGFVEEALYRGYAIERLASLTGSWWLAGVFAVAVFALVHLPFWGAGILFNTGLAGTVYTVVYIWRRDLWPCIIAHTVLDAIALMFR